MLTVKIHLYQFYQQYDVMTLVKHCLKSHQGWMQYFVCKENELTNASESNTIYQKSNEIPFCINASDEDETRM